MTLDLITQRIFQLESEIEYLEYQIYINPISDLEEQACKIKLKEVKQQLETVTKQLKEQTMKEG